MSRVRTVLGDIPAEELGVCYAHEHLYIGPGFVTEAFPDFAISDVESQARELKQLYQAGGRSVVDSMPCNAGRDVVALAQLSRLSGIQVIAPTGLHLPQYYPAWHWSHRADADDLAELFFGDITFGIDANDYNGPVVRRTGHRAGVIKVASGAAWTPREQALFEAAAEAHKQTGCPILTHTEAGELALKQVEVFRDCGVDLKHVCLSHTDRKPDEAYHREILDSGVKLEYDSAFRWKGREDNPTADLIIALITDYPTQLMLGMDMARRSYWTCYGGSPGLAYLITDFYRLLRERYLSEKTLETIFVTTPRETFSFGNPVP